TPPYPLPAHQTRSVFKTLSSPGGKGSNELRIEDRAGQEQIYVHAQRDWDQNIQHDQKIRVGHERHDRVEANSYSEFKAEEHRTIDGSRLTEVRMDDHLTVSGKQHIKVGEALLADVGDEIHLEAGDQVVIEAGLEITFKVGGSFIKIDSGGVTVSGPLVKLNSEGSPGVGSGVAALLPETPKAADTSAFGNNTKGPNPANTKPENTEQPVLEALIVDVWGDPAMGSQLQILAPEEDV
ncbi:bacteriophage T4 gp5 trimerisation domain-containing protein, partial [Pseudomonas viridiflava]